LAAADPATPDPSTLSLHDALPILMLRRQQPRGHPPSRAGVTPCPPATPGFPAPSSTPCTTRPCLTSGTAFSPSANSSTPPARSRDRKSTRLNSSHVKISYAVFCLK